MSGQSAIRLGLIGVGRWGKNFVRTVASLDDVILSAVASRNPATAAFVPAGCRVVERWQELVTCHDLDGVIVASPPHTHAEILLAAIAAGKPVLIEKPLVQSREQAKEIRAALAKKPATILVDHVHLFHPAFRGLQREAKVLGPIRGIESSAGNRGPYRRDISVLWDWGPHDLAMCLTLVPGIARALRAECLARQTIEQSIAESLALDLVLAGDVPAHVRLSTLDDRHRWFAVSFARDVLVYQDAAEHQLVRFPSGADIHAGAGTPIPVDVEMPLTRAVRDFAQAIRADSKDRTSVDIGLAITDLLGDFDDLLCLGHGKS